MKCKIYVNDVHMLTVDDKDSVYKSVDNMIKWLKDTGHNNIRIERN